MYCVAPSRVTVEVFAVNVPLFVKEPERVNVESAAVIVPWFVTPEEVLIDEVPPFPAVSVRVPEFVIPPVPVVTL